jgi:hypothetical protein
LLISERITRGGPHKFQPVPDGTIGIGRHCYRGRRSRRLKAFPMSDSDE